MADRAKCLKCSREYMLLAGRIRGTASIGLFRYADCRTPSGGHRGRAAELKELTVIFKQYYLECLSHASYLIGDEQAGVAIIVDPQRDIEQYVQDADACGLRITHVILTHFHADFLAGHIELRDEVGAKICMGVRALPEFEVQALADGDALRFETVRLEILETPGHTPEGISIVVFDEVTGDQIPHGVLTGDTLFIGDVGRPDLLASIGVTAEELSEMLYDSIDKLKSLPAETRVYPAHGAGSLCGRSLSRENVSTIGEQLEFNYAMQPMSLSEFQKLVLADQPVAPDYFVHDAVLNRKERPTLSEAMESSMQGLSLEAVLRHQTRHAQIVDVRDAVEFEGAHLDGAINIGLRGKFATWAGTMLENCGQIIVIADPGDEEEAVMRLGRIGFDNVIGFLNGGMAAIGDRDALLANVRRMTAKAVNAQLQSGQRPVIIDVRTPTERETGFISGSVSVPLNELRGRLDEFGRAQHLVVHCQGGYRSAIACSVLQRNGFADVRDMVGGINAWNASLLPLRKSESAMPQDGFQAV